MTPCKHPATRLYTWIAFDGERVIGCCTCGKILAGGWHPDPPRPTQPRLPIVHVVTKEATR